MRGNAIPIKCAVVYLENAAGAISKKQEKQQKSRCAIHIGLKPESKLEIDMVGRSVEYLVKF